MVEGRVSMFWVALATIVWILVSPARGTTDPQDVSALSILYSSLNSPQLSGWKANGGDPCGESWQGISCKGSNITSIKLSGQNLGGSLGYALDKLTSLLVLDLSNNRLATSLPYQLPPQIQELYLNNNQLSGGLPYSVSSLSALTHLNLGNNRLNDQLQDFFQNLNSLSFLDLSFNQLAGELPSTFADLGSLSTLYLQNNQLSGSINVLGQLPLQNLNIENNRFSGWVPASLLTIPNFRDGGNAFSNTPAPPPPPYTPPPPGTRASRGGIPPPKGPAGSQGSSSSSLAGGQLAGVIIAVILGIVAAALALVYFLWKKRDSADDEEKQSQTTWLRPLGGISPVKEEQSEETLEDLQIEKFLKPPPERIKVALAKERSPVKVASVKTSKVQVATTAFSVADLQVATNSFSQENLIGEGTLGRVYKGDLPDGKLVAVKKLDTSAQSVQNLEEFLSIVSSIARLHHANIVELIGHCTEHGQRLLIYDYIKRGTLHSILHFADENTKRLSWNQRVKIAMGAARALEYLHEVCSPPAIHKNFKSANILLDEDFNPHLADCGFVALSSISSDRQVSAQLLGSFGYSAPEYAMSGVYTAKSDVYSFGVVMLELLTGRKPLDSSRTRTQQSLVRWATPQLHDIDALSKMVDPALKGIYPAKSLSRFADIISLCVQPEPEFRPPMSEVVQALVRLMQRASLSKRKSGDDVGASKRTFDHSEAPDSSS